MLRLQLRGQAKALLTLLLAATSFGDYDCSNHHFSFPLPKIPGNDPYSQPSTGCCEHLAVPYDNGEGLKKPKLIGLGMHKSGTSKLYALLTKLSRGRIVGPKQKELYFWNGFPLSEHSYRDYLMSWENGTIPEDDERILFEITAQYLMHPEAACRMRRLIPDAKLVIILRDPVTRALSQFSMMRHFAASQELVVGGSDKKFEELIFRERAQLYKQGCTFNTGVAGKSFGDCFKCYATTPAWIPEMHQLRGELCDHPSMAYMHQHNTDMHPCSHWKNLNGKLMFNGMYAPAIAHWLTFFPPEQILLINSEDMIEDTIGQVNRVFDFVGIPRLIEKSSSRASGKEPGKRYADKYKSDQVRQAFDGAYDFAKAQVQDLYCLADRYRIPFSPFEKFEKLAQWPSSAPSSRLYHTIPEDEQEGNEESSQEEMALSQNEGP